MLLLREMAVPPAGAAELNVAVAVVVVPPGTDAGDTAIVTAIIAMAHSLRLHVVAEGVETSEQAMFLKSLGCEAAQGHHFSQAVPPQQFMQFLEVGSSMRNMPMSPAAVDAGLLG